MKPETIQALKETKCEHCGVDVFDCYDLESDPDNFPDFIPQNWYCSLYCYRMNRIREAARQKQKERK